MFGEERKRATPELGPAQNIGDPAPELMLPSVSGRRTKLGDFRGQPLVLLFWNPSCGFCLRMLEDLRFWERNPPSNAPQLLVVSTGPHEVNRKMDLRSEIVLDDDFLVGRAFKSTGTPSAVLLDGRGALLAPLATGEDAVRSLLGFGSLAGAVSGGMHRSS
ncbi:peroxiredoxin family protein [Tunturibacter empetritectus]|uniref:peroxiredoxin family protein n=2 Tax=Tunturiibacter empetritectus TaxID=3069691 RepID=UPI001620859C